MFMRFLWRIENACNNVILATDAIDIASDSLKNLVTDIKRILAIVPDYDTLKGGYSPADCVMSLVEKEADQLVRQQPAGLKSGFEVLDKRPSAIKPIQDTVSRLLVVLENYSSIGYIDSSSISEIKEISDPDCIRNMTSKGWEIIDISEVDDSFKFKLGRL